MAKPSSSAATRLRSFLDNHGITLTAAGKVFGVSHSAVRKWTLGLSTPSSDHCNDLEVWTHGYVKASSWPRARARRVVPFRFQKAS